jgi:HlyD family secretion protein
MEIEAEVNENDVVNISLQDTAHIEIDAYPDRVFRGVVTEIANSARIAAAGTQEQVTNFPVKIRILDPHNEGSSMNQGVEVGSGEIAGAAEVPDFRPGMSGTVDVYTDFAPDCVTVPIQSVTVRDFNRLDEEEDEDGRGPRDDDEEEWTASFEEEDLRRVVFTVADGNAKMVEVETGISDEARIQITSGLEGAESVVTGPYGLLSRTLKDGQKVKVRD